MKSASGHRSFLARVLSLVVLVTGLLTGDVHLLACPCASSNKMPFPLFSLDLDLDLKFFLHESPFNPTTSNIPLLFHTYHGCSNSRFLFCLDVVGLGVQIRNSKFCGLPAGRRHILLAGVPLLFARPCAALRGCLRPATVPAPCEHLRDGLRALHLLPAAWGDRLAGAGCVDAAQLVHVLTLEMGNAFSYLLVHLHSVAVHLGEFAVCCVVQLFCGLDIEAGVLKDHEDAFDVEKIACYKSTMLQFFVWGFDSRSGNLGKNGPGHCVQVMLLALSWKLDLLSCSSVVPFVRISRASTLRSLFIDRWPTQFESGVATNKSTTRPPISDAQSDSFARGVAGDSSIGSRRRDLWLFLLRFIVHVHGRYRSPSVTSSAAGTEDASFLIFRLDLNETLSMTSSLRQCIVGFIPSIHVLCS